LPLLKLQPSYVYRNNEARPHNHCYRGNAVLHILGVEL